MATKPQKTTPQIGDPLSAPEFRLFVQHFPDYHLEPEQTGLDFTMKPTTFYAVGMALAQFGDYESGTRVRPTQKALADVARVDPRTVKQVLGILKKRGAIEVVDKQRRAGSASEVYRFRRSAFAHAVLDVQNRHWRPEGQTKKKRAVRGAKTGVQLPKTGVQLPKTGVQLPTDAVAPNNKNQSELVRTGSVAESPSPSPTALSATHRAEAREGRRTPDEVITDGFAKSDDLSDLLAGL